MSAAKTRSAATAPRPVSGRFALLFSVSFQHDYYNASSGACPDLAVSPTPACAGLMRSLGMIFRDQGTGFAVLIEEARVGALLVWLAGRADAAAPGRGCWAWLSFQLVAANPGFVGITSLPITTNTMTEKLYVSNLETVMPGTSILLGGAGGVGAAMLYPVAGAQIAAPMAAGQAAMLLDASGAPVAAQASAVFDAAVLDMSGLPDGFYRVDYTDAAGTPASSPPGQAAAPGYVYAPSRPFALGQIDLFLAQPHAGVGDPSAFPVTALALTATAGPPEVAGVSLTLAFRARDTYWRYYIVSHATRGALAGDLAISGSGTTFARTAEALPNGDQAVVFAAAAPLPLQQQSTYRFSLSGQRQAVSGGRDAISIAQLPTAPSAPVWPAPDNLTPTGDGLAGSSEIYVYV